MSFVGIAAVGAGIGIAAGAAKSISGASQVRKGKRMLRKAVDPGYKIPEEFQTNLAQGEQMARLGLPSEQYNLATTNIQRGTQAGLRQLGRMSNPFAGISGLARAQSDSMASLDAANAAARRQNILQAMGLRSQLAQQKLAQQQYSQERYFDAVNQANAMIGAGRQNVAGGLNTIGNIGMSAASFGSGGGKQTMGQMYGNPYIPRTSGVGVSNSGTPSTINKIPFPNS